MTGSAPRHRPTFVLSLDTELIWGSLDRSSPVQFEREFPGVRATIGAILRLLEAYEVPATWAVVGHLMLGACGPNGARAHPELVLPPAGTPAAGWYGADPASSRAAAPLFYGDDILEALLAAGTPQEIGCHSFVHAPYDFPGMTQEVVAADLAACVRAAERSGIRLRSFVFPRNREAHHEALRAAGFQAYRGADPTWHRSIGGPIGRAAHLADQALAIAPPVSVPTERLPGLWNVPGSMLLMHRAGPRRLISGNARVRKARLGLERAVREGGVFHLWTHPFNLTGGGGLVDCLERILRHAVALRDRGALAIETMATVAEAAAGAGGR